MKILTDLSKAARLTGVKRILLADAISKSGDWVLFVAVSVLLFRSGGAAALVVFNVVRIALPILMGPWSGSWGAQLPAQRVLVIADTGRALVLGLAALLAVGESSPWLLVLLVLCSTLLGTWYGPAEKRFQRDVVPATQRADFNAVIGATGSTVMIVAPAIGGALLAAASPAVALAVDAVSFAVAASAVASMRVAGAGPVQTGEAERPTTSGVLTTALGVLRADGFVRVCLLTQTVACTVAGASLVMFVPVVDHVGAADAAVGWLASSIGIGSLLGVLAGGWVGREGRLVLGVASIAAMGLALGLLGASPNLGLALAAAAASGFLANIPEPLYWTSYADRVAPSSSGPFYGLVESAIVGAFSVGGILAGVAVASRGVTTAGWVIGLPGTALAVALTVTARRWQARPHPVPTSTASASTSATDPQAVPQAVEEVVP